MPTLSSRTSLTSLSRSIRLTALLGIAFCLGPACRRKRDAPPPDSSVDSPVDSDTELSPDCPELLEEEGALVLDACWVVLADAQTTALAELLVSGTFLMGCEDEFPAMAIAEQAPDSARGTLRLEVDATLAAQAYQVRHEGQSITLRGGSAQGLRFGITDFLASLDRVELEGGGQWRPDPTDSLSAGPTICSDYDSSCTENEVCWSAGWTPVTRAVWRPQEVDNAPDVDLRMAFASFKGTQNSHFLPNIVYSELATCPSPQETEAFWEGLLQCDRQSEGTCLEAQRRLDAVVSGRFTHALDEGHPMQVGQSTELFTGCDGAQLYGEMVAYLDARGVALVSTAYGLETRIPGTPVAGPRIADEDPAELWGVAGDASLSQGIGLEHDFLACEIDGETYLAPDDCEQLDAEGRVQGPLWLTESVDIDSIGISDVLSSCGPLEICATKEECWEPTEGPFGLAMTPIESCSNPVLRMPLPEDGAWYALHFFGAVPESRDLIVKLITKDSAGLTNALELEVISTDPEEGEYLNPFPGLSADDPDMVRYSVVFRAPEAEERLTDAYLQLMAAGDSGVLVDELRVASVAGQLHNVDPGSLIGPECLELIDGAQSPLSVAPFFDGQDGSVQGAALRADCVSPGDRVTVAYRSWTHFGLWPGIATRQKTYTYTPGIYQQAWWSSPTAPSAQLQGQDLGEWLLLSDLGGEARGVDRLGPLSETSAAETLASYVCAIEATACEDCGSCAEMFLPFSDPDFGPCACADWPTETGPRLLIAGDMFTPLHNGGDGEGLALREGYQVPHGGDWGPSWAAREDLPSDAAFLTWWHYDSRRAGKAVGGHETLMGFVESYAETGHASIGASAWDPDNQRVWAALAAGSGETHALPVAGVAQFGWSSDAQGVRVMHNASRWFWSPGWSHVQAWLISDNPDLPGGDETLSTEMEGFVLERSTNEMIWPQTGKWARVSGEAASWASPQVAVSGERVLARVHAALPEEDCSLTLRFSFDQGDSEEVVLSAEHRDYRVVGHSVALPEGAQTAGLAVAFSDCPEGILDAVTLYSSLPVVDFPYAWEGESFEDWDGAENVDARPKICGDAETWDCVNADTWQ